MDCDRGRPFDAIDNANELQSGEPLVRTAGQRDPDLTRRVILEAATTEFARNGHAGASVNVIAAAANVNKRMLYHYFGKKDDLYLAVLERAYRHLRAAQTRLRLTELEPCEAIESLVMFTWNYYLEHPELLRLFTGESQMHALYLRRSPRIRELHKPLIAMLADVLQRGAAGGAFRAPVDPLQLYLTMSSLASHFLTHRAALSALFGDDLDDETGLALRAQNIVDAVMGCLRP